MQQGWISAADFCGSHNLELSFVYRLEQYGLLEITTIEEAIYLPEKDLEKVEKIARLYEDLGINLEGIDAITHLLDRIQSLQEEILNLQNKLSLYEGK
jgi:hypothetical protein